MTNPDLRNSLSKFEALGFESFEALGQALLNASQREIYVYLPVKDANQFIVDFEIILHNRRDKSNETSVAQKSSLFSQNFPTLVVDDLLPLMIKSCELGESFELERLYFNSAYRGHHRFNIIKLGKGVLIFNSNITAAIEAEKELRESREMLRAILNAPNIGIAVCKAIRNSDNLIVDFVHEFTNRRTIETIGRDMTGHLLSEYGQDGFGQLPQFTECIETNRQVTYTKVLTIKGVTYDVLLSNAPLGNDRLVHVWEDVSPIRNMQEELTRLQLQQQKEILNAIILAQEQERERIGEALHNGVAQLLYGIKTRLDTLRNIEGSNLDILHDVQGVINDAIDEARKISFELVPAVLKDHGLETAVRALFQRISSEQISLEFSCIKPKRLPESIEYTLYRIIQEALGNVVKHSAAQRAQVLIHQKSKLLHVEINDDGKGFEPENIDPMSSGIGLQHIQQRVKLLNGILKIKSGRKGTSLQIRLPFGYKITNNS